MTKYVFVLSPSYSGSTVLWRLLQTSPSVSALPKEGQYLDPVKNIMLPNRWNINEQFPWALIREEWSKYWDFEKPLLLEKSPPNLLRAREIEQVFSPCFFIVMMRNPYALCEGYARRHNRRKMIFGEFRHIPPRNGNIREYAMEFAANVWTQFADCQVRNIRQLERVIHFTYEDLVENTSAVLDKLLRFLPELGQLNPALKFHIHSVTGTDSRSLTNMNDTKWQCLRKRDIEVINTVLETRRDLLDFFGYELRQPDPIQDLRSLIIRSKSLLLKVKNEGREVLSGRKITTLRRRLYHEIRRSQ